MKSLCLRSDGQCAISGGGFNLKLWDIDRGECLRTFEGHEASVNSISLLRNCRHALSGSEDHTARLWEVATGRCLRVLHPGHTVQSVHMTADGRHALLGTGGSLLQLYDLTNGQLVRSVRGCLHGSPFVSLSADGRAALTGGRDQKFHLKSWQVPELNWRTRFGAFHVLTEQDLSSLRTTIHHNVVVATKAVRDAGELTGEITAVCLSSDGQHAFSGSDDGSIMLWEVATGKCLWSAVGHSGAVSSICLTSDGRYALSGSHDKTVRLWCLDWELAAK